jgi:glycosyltransferase involved in cell wall biosynthesis
MCKINKIITIATPSFNQGEFLSRTIESIWSQEGGFYIQHIIADGGSTDNSVDIIKKYDKLLKEGDYPIKCKGIELIWWSKKDKGQADALNKCFEKAKGNILGWLNSDDTYCSNKSLQYIFEVFRNKDVDIVIGNAYYIDEKDNIKNDYSYIKKIGVGIIGDLIFEKNLLQNNFIPQPSTFFAKEVYKKIGVENKWHYFMDWVMWIEALKNNFNFYKMNEYLGNLRSQKNAKTVIRGINFYTEKLRFYKKYKIWGLNRIYCYFMIVEDKIDKIPVVDRWLNFLFRELIKLLGFIKKRLFKKSNPVG